MSVSANVCSQIRDLCLGPIPNPEESNRVCVCVCVCVCVISCNKNPLRLQRVDRTGQTKKEKPTKR